jgi:hypothetical protein
VPPARARQMDMGPRRTSAQVSSPVPRPAASSPRAATDLHRGRGTGGILDLRHIGPTAPAPATASIQHAAVRTPAQPPAATTHERHIARFTDRFDHAKKFDRSPHINKFADSFGNPTLETLVHPAPAPTPAPAAPIPELPRLTTTQHEAMTKLVQPAPAPTPAPAVTSTTKPSWRPSLKLSPPPKRVLTTAAAIAILSGYIWLQNYPKLALQSASNQAGLNASLPGYLPSSYNLANTQTRPGLVTLNFRSPSAGEILQIRQSRTAWDSHSLLDNYVTKQTDDYSTIHGQGLTIYVFGQNQAAWVNHGIWYSIKGATRLSREQILKIAYSL